MKATEKNSHCWVFSMRYRPSAKIFAVRRRPAKPTRSLIGFSTFAMGGLSVGTRVAMYLPMDMFSSGAAGAAGAAGAGAAADGAGSCFSSAMMRAQCCWSDNGRRLKCPPGREPARHEGGLLAAGTRATHVMIRWREQNAIEALRDSSVAGNEESVRGAQMGQATGASSHFQVGDDADLDKSPGINGAHLVLP
jgi:hypothetical protein